MDKMKGEREKKIISLDDLEPPTVAKRMLALVTSSKQEDDPCSVENILIMLKEANGMKKIGGLWLE